MGNILKKLIFLSACFSLIGLERRSKPEPLSVYKELNKWDRLKCWNPQLPRTRTVDFYENTKKKKD